MPAERTTAYTQPYSMCIKCAEKKNKHLGKILGFYIYPDRETFLGHTTIFTKQVKLDVVSTGFIAVFSLASVKQASSLGIAGD